MPGVDLLGQLGASPWMTADGTKLQYAVQRARFDMMGVVSRRAMAGDLSGGNAEVKALVDSAPTMRGWVVVNPNYPERSAEDLRKYVGGPKWLGAVLYPEFNGQRLDSAVSRELLNSYRRYTKPLMVHIPDKASIRDLEAVAPDFNTIKFVAMGAGGDSWQDAIIAAKRHVNIFLEPFSGGAHRGKIEAISTSVGVHRVVFASNYPDHNPGAALGLLMDAKISDGDKQSILATNAIKLFGLRREPAPEG